MFEPAAVRIALGQLHLCAAIELHGQGAVADPGQRAGLAVDDAEPPVIAGRHDTVTDGKGAIGGRELVVAEAAGGAQALARAAVEV